MKSFAIAAALIGGALADQGAWAQCGGIGWTGGTKCVSGYSCVKSNDYYSQCLPGANTLTTSTKAVTTSGPAPTGGAGAAGKLRWLGVSESVAEFGSGTYPGTYGKDFYFPDSSTIQTLIQQGYNIFRVAFAMERIVQGSVGGALNTAYLTNLTTTINAITNAGAYAVLDPHNFGRFNGAIITSTSDFQSFWNKLATQFKSNSKVIFDTNNEYHDMDQTLVLNLNQAAINGIRAAGATSQYIFVEGNSYTGAWTWNTTNTNLAALTDPQNKIVYEMHQYLDSDGSGTSATCVSANIGVQRIVGATQWLKANGKQGVLGEFAGGANSVCQTAVTGLLDHLVQNSDVWTGALWWAAGPWWGNYIYSFEPPSGTGYSYYNSLLKTYAP
ncbi:glycoside hydrolase [Coniochaeta ligniaria NRRL 30616]|uniref:cellulase n=1 Tax=Coniochaeta ligniaria NRRL 30616 TaxID=1408157 RepID=A0A1J7IN71_9PEZI|nr:glycoside hydrolase [Coniochaeta ligniaria NRRL 30616]